MAYQKAGYPYHPRPGKDIAPVKRHNVTMKVGETISLCLLHCIECESEPYQQTLLCMQYMHRSELANLYLAS